MADEPPKKKTKTGMWIAIAQVQGCGIRVTINFNDSEEASDIIKMVLTNKDKEMPMLHKKFRGYKHLQNIDIDGMMVWNSAIILTGGSWPIMRPSLAPTSRIRLNRLCSSAEP